MDVVQELLAAICLLRNGTYCTLCTVGKADIEFVFYVQTVLWV